MSEAIVQPVEIVSANGTITATKDGEYVLVVVPHGDRYRGHLTLTRIDACPTTVFDFGSASGTPEGVLRAFWFNALLRPFTQTNSIRNGPLIETLVANRNKENDGKVYEFSDSGVEYVLEYISPYKVKVKRFSFDEGVVTETVRIKHFTKAFLRKFLS